MEKTIKSLFLLMIITGTIFTLTACNSGIGSQYPDKRGEVVADEAGEEAADAAGGEVGVVSDAGEVSDDVAGADNEDSEVEEFVSDEGVDAGVNGGDGYASPEVEGADEDISADSAVLENAGSQAEDSAFKYEDGTYSNEATYFTPETEESILVTISLNGDVVTDVVVTGKTLNETVKKFQGLFISGINAVVVGKKLDEIGELSAVNGSSLTPNGFNSAVALLKAEAKK